MIAEVDLVEFSDLSTTCDIEQVWGQGLSLDVQYYDNVFADGSYNVCCVV